MGCILYQTSKWWSRCVSIHAAQAGCDLASVRSILYCSLFQFTQPKRAATVLLLVLLVVLSGFNSRSPSGLRQYFAAYCATHTVSIHAAQTGCDSHFVRAASAQNGFNSRSPSGLRQEIGVSLIPQYVSIHAAQASCDLVLPRVPWFRWCFNSRSPSGLRPSSRRVTNPQWPFQFTQPKRAATLFFDVLQLFAICFNSRSPSELRLRGCLSAWSRICFNSRSPSGLRPSLFASVLPIDHPSFNSRSPSGLRLIKSNLPISGCRFNSRSPSGLRHPPRARRLPLRCFNSRSPSGLRRLLQRYNKKDILSKDKSRKSLLVIILDEEDKAIGLELTDNQALRNSNKIMFT